MSNDGGTGFAVDAGLELESADLEKPRKRTTFTSLVSSADSAAGPLQRVAPGLCSAFGWQFLAFLICTQHISVGWLDVALDAAWPNIMREYRVSAPKVAEFSSVLVLPSAMKPLIGLISDTYPLMGFPRMPYLAAAAMTAVLPLAMLGSMRHELSVRGVVRLLWITKFCMSVIDLLSEATYASMLRTKPWLGPALVSFVWAGRTIADAVGSVVTGMIIQSTSVWALYSLGVVLAFCGLLPVLLNWHGEEQLSSAHQAVRRERLQQQVEVVGLSIVITLSSVVLAWSGMTLTVAQNAALSMVVLLLVLFSFSAVLNPTIAKVNAFSLLQTVLSMPLSGASFYFQRDSPRQYPDGPHFSMFFYSSVRPFFGAVFAMIGVYIYYSSAGSWTYRRVFVIGNFFQAISRLFDVAFYLRLNKRWGVDDTLFFLGSESLESMLEQWLWMPCVAIYSQLAPQGLEAIMYANLAGCHYLGTTVATNFGALMMELLGVRPSGRPSESSQFDNLWRASLITALLPLLPVLFAPHFIPNKLNTERILERDDTPANEGSLYQRWRHARLAEQQAMSEARAVTGRGAAA